jgi:drug/metabolite transporter (DMT)-like permease
MTSSQNPAKGVALGMLSAVAYTLTNLALREAADRDDPGWAMWVTAHKGFPAALTAWTIIAWRARQGLPALPPRQFVLPLIGTGLLIQLVGNMSFQLSLSFGGLALTVALTFSTLIISSALLSRIMLGEGIGVQTAISMVLMIVAVTLLSFGADATHALPVTGGRWSELSGILFGCTAGCGYGFAGVIIRKAVRADLSLSATLVLMSSTGVVVMGSLGLLILGPRAAFSTPLPLEITLLLGGAMNAVAFFSVGGALRHLEVVRLNLVNSSQVAMAAAAGIFLFGESVSFRTGAGIALTMLGLAVMGLGRPRAPTEHGTALKASSGRDAPASVEAGE